MVEYSSHESPYNIYVNSYELDRSVEQQGDDYSPDIVDTLRSLKEEIKSCKEDNSKLIEEHEIFSRAWRNKQRLM